jgi:hypothetical protein
MYLFTNVKKKTLSAGCKTLSTYFQHVYTRPGLSGAIASCRPAMNWDTATDEGNNGLFQEAKKIRQVHKKAIGTLQLFRQL